MTSSRSKSDSVRVLYLVRMLDGAAFSSLMPFVLLHFTKSLGLTPAYSGAILSLRQIVPVFTGVALGWVVTRTGSRRTLVGSLAALAVSTFAWMLGLGGDVGLWIFSILSGIALSAERIAFNTAVAEVKAAGEEAEGFAALHAFGNVGFAAGPLLNAHWVAHEQYAKAFLVPICLYAASTALTAVGLENAAVKADEAPKPGGWRRALSEFAVSDLVLTAAIMLVVMVNGARLEMCLLGLGKYMVDYFGSTRATSLYWTVESLCVVALVQYGGALVKKWSTRRLFLAFVGGTALVAAAPTSLGFFGKSQLYPAFGALVTLAALGECLAVPASGVLLVNLLGPKRAGFVFGLVASVAAIGMSLGASAGGVLIEYSWKTQDLPLYWLGLGAGSLTAYFAALIVGEFVLRGRARRATDSALPLPLPEEAGV